MSHAVLETLKSDDFALRFAFISNARAVHRALQRNKHVQNIKDALRRGEITERAIQRFSTELIRELRHGELFPHELALAAIAVALEMRATSFAEEFVLDLARLEIAELPTAIRVARESAQIQSVMAGNKSKVFSMDGAEDLPIEWCKAPEPPEVRVAQSDKCFEFGEA